MSEIKTKSVIDAKMKLYIVSTKYGRSPFQGRAYVEAGSPCAAIQKYCGSAKKVAANKAEGFKYRATITTLPSYYWSMADYCRLPYIGAVPTQGVTA